MLFRVVFVVNGRPFYTPIQTLQNLKEDSITVQTAHLIQYIDVGEVFTIVHTDGNTYLVIRVQ